MHPTFREDINQTKWSIKTCGNSSVGRARPCQGRGREFESRFPLQIFQTPQKTKTYLVFKYDPLMGPRPNVGQLANLVSRSKFFRHLKKLKLI